MSKYGFTDEQVRNIKIFLQRTNLSGEEVAAFNQIISSLNQPIKDPSPEQVVKELTTDQLIVELQSREDWDVSDLDIDVEEDENDEEEIAPTIEEKPKKTYKVKKSALKKKG